MAVIVSSARTPIGKFGGALASVSASDLGGIVIQALLDRSGCRAQDIDEVIMGNVLQAGQGQGPARQAAIKAGLPVSVPGTTVNNICGSGLKSVNLAVAMIDSGYAEVVFAGGYGKHECGALHPAKGAVGPSDAQWRAGGQPVERGAG